MIGKTKPRRSGLEGNMMAQPRMFAHDAAVIPDLGTVTSIQLISGGADYPVGTSTRTVTSTTTGVGLTVEINVDAEGTVTSATIVADGSGYILADEDILVYIDGNIPGSTDATLLISTAIPGTDQRGCCLYIGVAMNITVVMESGSTVEYNGVPAGSFMPIEVTHVTAQSAGDEDDILALF